MEMESTDTTTMVVGDINQLPEECISLVISITSPRDACVSSAVSHAFQSAAESDATWRRFLPSDYAQILAQAVNQVEYASLKELYFRLCDHPLLTNGGLMSFGLERSSGVKCFMISARALSIVWGDHTIYWNWIDLPDSRFAEVAELRNVCWLDINGSMDSTVLTRNTAYSAYLVFKLRANAIGLGMPSQATYITLGGERVCQHFVCLDPAERQRRNNRIEEDVKVPRERGDGWMEIELGEFNSGDGIDGEVGMSFKEIRSMHWKRGLIVHGIEVRPTR